jgi:hypothetical protein
MPIHFFEETKDPNSDISKDTFTQHTKIVDKSNVQFQQHCAQKLEEPSLRETTHTHTHTHTPRSMIVEIFSIS